MDIQCAGFTFISNFDSGNLARVEEVTKPSSDKGGNDVGAPDFEFNIWTQPDCAGTEFENESRTWFHFGIKGGTPFALVKLNMVNLNRQSKMYSQGMAPVFRISPGRSSWERIRDKPTFNTEDNVFTMSFKYRTLENLRSITYFAFTYPYSYSELQTSLSLIDSKLLSNSKPQPRPDDIYYHREPVCYSLEGRRVELLTISSYHNISAEREPRLANLFPDTDVPRPFQFTNKKVVFLSARVHPGETPSSFVLNGVLTMLLNKDDVSAQVLRRLYVFKLIPMLNPDGVARGHYRTDTRGVNLNRVYNNPSPTLHPSIYAARSLIRYHHYGEEVPETDDLISNRVSGLSLELSNNLPDTRENLSSVSSNSESIDEHDDVKENSAIMSKLSPISSPGGPSKEGSEHFQSGLFLYVDFHGHASKKGIFIYGNHFSNPTDNVECMLLPKLMSLNSHHFHWTSCNFSERIMYLRDRHGGLSREGCGRVAVLKATGLVRSYTLECNYNTGQMVNILPPTQRDAHDRRNNNLLVPPKYSPSVFEEVGKGLCYSILDLTGANPNSRLCNSEFRSLCGVRDWLRKYVMVTESTLQPKPLNQVRFGIRLTPLVDVKPKPSPARNVPVVLQVRTKCAAILALASTSTSKPAQVLRRNKAGADDVNKKTKRLKVSDENRGKWKVSRSDEVLVPWRSGSRLEKKSGGDLSRRFSTTDRRKKPKPK
ncbi:cytosolic carboxypeptidase-like protein 5 [Macrosteles quadrilineatus]|uniref:cytosolic carboxypeptidase-like protein 5 n=1 Tax=Macrosteles quadrilineatus TaxID=74068 RepID=UPI0023E12433|nr:cytosolic carboxypeptidase-like protein 5 [Macrosteles quadrilineatus]XP_054266256.1 cytosolic carboxypeptidase-like protein 5 [Macrosteles quadrilineatus]